MSRVFRSSRFPAMEPWRSELTVSTKSIPMALNSSMLALGSQMSGDRLRMDGNLPECSAMGTVDRLCLHRDHSQVCSTYRCTFAAPKTGTELFQLRYLLLETTGQTQHKK